MASFAHVGQRLPDFLIIGVQKAGTRWLLNNLRQHPEIGMPHQELHFFDKKAQYQKGLDWYADQFEAYEDKKLVGEKTPDYIWVSRTDLRHHQSNIHERIHQHLPNAKLVVVLRNPVDRAISAINHLLRGGYMTAKQLGDVFENTDLIEQHGIVDMGHYERHLKAYHQLFPSEQMLHLVYERDVKSDPQNGFAKLLSFLGASPVDDNFLDLTPMNVSKTNVGTNRTYSLAGRTLLDKRKKWEPAYSERQKLTAYYEPLNEKLFEFLGYRIHEWND